MRGICRLWVVSLSVLLVAGCAAKPDSRTSTAEVTQLVEGFGRTLQTVSLLTPNVSEEISRAYTEFIDPELLESWLSDPTLAPGRMVSSPWPDRIEIASISPASNGRYVVEGEIVEITSWELVNGGAANTVPVRITVQWIEDGWLITEFVEREG